MAGAIEPRLLDALGRVFAEDPDSVRVIGPNGEVLLRNPAALAFPPHGLGHSCAPESRGHDSSCPACRLEVALREGSHERWHVRIPGRAGPGAGRSYEVTLWPVRDEGGRLLALVETLRDMTAILGLEQYLIRTAESQEEEIRQKNVEAEELLERAQTLRTELGALRDSQADLVYHDRLLALGLLVSALAHEIHTPLGAVAANADLLRRYVDRLRGLNPSGDAVVEERLAAMNGSVDVIAEGARRIQGVVRTLQVFSRLDEAARKEVNLHENLDSTLSLLAYRIAPAIEVVREYREVPPVLCRPDALNQVFLNLLLNAVQSIPGHGEIRVRTRTERGWVVVEIEDTGVGIAPEVLPRLFELGFTTRGPGKGTGIGLALSRRIVESHGGTIEVVSEPGHGSTFTIRLPIGFGKIR